MLHISENEVDVL